MLSHRHLSKLMRRSKDAVARMRRQIGLGIAPDLAMVDAMEEIEEAHDELALLDADQLGAHSIDWEVAGIVMAEGLRDALKARKLTGSDNAAYAAFSKRVERLTRPKLWR